MSSQPIVKRLLILCWNLLTNENVLMPIGYVVGGTKFNLQALQASFPVMPCTDREGKAGWLSLVPYGLRFPQGLCDRAHPSAPGCCGPCPQGQG